MRWTKEGAHLLLQLRVKTLNDELEEHFHNWYPQIKLEGSSVATNIMVAAAYNWHINVLYKSFHA